VPCKAWPATSAAEAVIRPSMSPPSMSPPGTPPAKAAPRPTSAEAAIRPSMSPPAKATPRPSSAAEAARPRPTTTTPAKARPRRRRQHKPSPEPEVEQRPRSFGLSRLRVRSAPRRAPVARPRSRSASADARGRSRSRSRSPGFVRARGSIGDAGVMVPQQAAARGGGSGKCRDPTCPRPAKECFQGFCCKMCADYFSGEREGRANRHGPQCAWGVLTKSEWRERGESNLPSAAQARFEVR